MDQQQHDIQQPDQQNANYFYPQDDQSYQIQYPHPIPPYPNLAHPGAARNNIVPDMYNPHNLNLMNTGHQYPTQDMYEHPLSPPLSGSDTSEGLYHHSNSSGANSPSSSRSHSLVQRTPRYNPTPSPTSSSGRRRGRSHDSDDDDNMGLAYVENLAHSRKEATRRQRIEAEQRRRDELRDGYAKLKDALPVSNQKSSKVSLLERATQHIQALEKENKDLQQRLAYLEAESTRLRALNEKISLSAEGTASPEGTSATLGRPLSPPPDSNPAAAAAAGVLAVPQLPQQLSQRPLALKSERSSPSASDGSH